MPGVLSKSSIGRDFSAHMAVYYWPEIVGKGIAEHVKALRIENKILFLYSENPSWSNQIMYMKMDIISKVNHYMGARVIEDIRFSNRWQRDIQEPKKKTDDDSFQKELSKVELQDREISEVQTECFSIQNESLRNAVKNALLKRKKREKLVKSMGWHKCKSCGVYIPESDTFCPNCSREAQDERISRIREFLRIMPWARYSDIYQKIDCTADEVNRQRIELLQSILMKLAPGDTESIDAGMAVMLYRSVPPQQLTTKFIEENLQKLRYDIDPNLSYKEYLKKKASGTLKRRK